jgi:hypothetical protein
MLSLEELSSPISFIHSWVMAERAGDTFGGLSIGESLTKYSYSQGFIWITQPAICLILG